MANQQKGEAEAQLARMNDALRENPEYQKFLQSLGVRTDVAEGQAWRLTDQQRKKAEDWVEARTGPLGKRMEIDISGNINQNEGMAKQVRKWGPIVAAGVATALTAGGAAPLLATAIGAGAAGAASGALDEGGWKGALYGGAMGVGGALGGAGIHAARGAGAAGSALGGGGGAAFDAAPAISSAQGAANAASLGWTVPGGTAAALGGGVGGSVAPVVAGAGGGGSAWRSLLGNKSDLIGAGGAAAGAISQAMASNRGTEFGGQLDLEQTLLLREKMLQDAQIAREQEGRTGRTDAWRALLGAQRVLSPAARPNITPYAAPQRAATEAERTGADAITREVSARLQGGNPIPVVRQHDLAVDPRLLKSSAWESILGGIGAGGAAYGSLSAGRAGAGSYADLLRRYGIQSGTASPGAVMHY